MMRLALAGIALMLAGCVGCVESNQVHCDDGRVCPPDNTCDDENQRCLSPEQTAACANIPDGDACTFDSAPGKCANGVCEPMLCGDGVRAPGEACDGSDLGGADCGSAGYYESPGLACTQFCTFDTSGCMGGHCGDHIINGPELCDGAPPPATCVDDGFDAGTLGCTACAASFVDCASFGWRPEATGLDQGFDVTGTQFDLWAAGISAVTGAIAHFSGSEWTTTIVPGTSVLVALDTTGSGDVWAVGLTSDAQPVGAIVHVTGNGTTLVTGAPVDRYFGVRAFASADVYVASATHGVLHFDGASWQPVGDLTAPLNSLAGTSGSDLWVTETDGTLEHWNGAAWTLTPTGGAITHVSAIADGDAIAIGSIDGSNGTADSAARWDGQIWHDIAVPFEVNEEYVAVVATADDDVWVAKSDASVAHFDGTSWAATVSGVTASAVGFAQMRALGAERIAVGFDGALYRYTGQIYGRSQLSNSLPGAQTLWVDRADDAFVIDAAGHIFHFDGETWTVQTSPSQVGGGAIFGTGSDDVWASTATALEHYDGSAWTAVSGAPTQIDKIWASSPTDVWLGGGLGLDHYDGSTFTNLGSDFASSSVLAVAGNGSGDVWVAVSAAGTGDLQASDVYHWTGSGFAVPPDHFDRGITALVGVGSDQVFAIADGDHVLQHEGGAWSDSVVSAGAGLASIAGDGPTDVFAASFTQLFHWDGARWTPVATDPAITLMPGDSGTKIKGLQVQAGVIDALIVPPTSPLQLSRLIRTVPF
jgi:hypothetical protein